MITWRATLPPILLLAAARIAGAQPPGGRTQEPGRPAASVHLDLGIGLRTSLLTRTIRDEGREVAAADGKQFLLVPFRYDPGRAQSFSKQVIRTRPARAFYGIRLLDCDHARPHLDRPDDFPVYERVNLKPAKPGGTGEIRLSAVNAASPRTNAPEKEKAGRPRPKSEYRAATGCGLLVFEVPADATGLTLELPNGGEEKLDLSFLHRGGQVLLEQLRLAVDEEEEDEDEDKEFRQPPEALTGTLEIIAGGTPAMAAYAVESLALARAAWPAAAPRPWADEADAAVLAAAARARPPLRRAIWAYFTTRTTGGDVPATLSSAVLDQLASADEALHKRWLQVIACGLGRSPGGLEWPSPANSADDAHSKAVASLLGSILRSERPGTASRALDLLMGLDARTLDAAVMNRASPQARRLALDRIAVLKDPAAARRLLRLLLLEADIQTAEPLRDSARRMDLAIADETDPILQRWETLTDPAGKTALLIALQGVDLSRVVYTQAFAAIVRDVTRRENGDDPARKALREAGWDLILQQAAPPPLRPTASRPAAVIEAFPLIVSRSARDPLVEGLREAARHASRPRRIQAMMALLRAGYSEEAQRALTLASAPEDVRNSLLRRLLAEQDLPEPVRLAMLGHLLRPQAVSSVPLILDHLDRVKQHTPADRRWLLHASLKAGVNLIELNHLVGSMEGPASTRLLEWIKQLAHMTPQDAQRLDAASTPRQRAEALERVDLRRARLVDGNYGVVGVIETSERLPPASDPGASPASGGWGPPRRAALVLPPLRLESLDGDRPTEAAPFRVRWGTRQIGTGNPLARTRPIGGPAKFSPALLVAPWKEWTNLGQTEAGASADAVGPLVLPCRKLLTEPPPGHMTIDIGEYLRQALKESAGLNADEAGLLVPVPWQLTLSYASFGSYYGAGRGPAPEPDRPGRARLINVLLVLEKMD